MAAEAGYCPRCLNFQTKCKINLLVTTRRVPEIIDEFRMAPTVDIRASEQDVRIYVASHIDELPRFVRKNPDLQQMISTAIFKAVDGL